MKELLANVGRPRLVLLGAVVLFALCHLYQLSAPPSGYHAWRESDTAAIILNYYQEDPNFFQPRINQRGDASGITGMELPLYNYGVVILYNLFGPHHFLARGLTLILGCLVLLLVAGIARMLLGESTAGFAAWCMAFSPLFFFYGFKIMPDVTMLTLYLAAIFAYLKYQSSDRVRWWLVSLVCLTLSACIKPLGLSIYLLWVIIWWQSQRSRRQSALLGAYIVVSFATTLGWFQYAQEVNELHQSAGFYLGEKLAIFHEYLFASQFVEKLVVQWPWELWIGWGLVPATLLGLFAIRRTKRTATYLAIWIVATFIVFAITAMHSASHDYYTLIIVPPLAIISGFGLKQLTCGARYRQALLVLLLVAGPIGAWARIGSRLSGESNFHQIRAAAKATIPPDALVMVQDPTTAIRLYQLNRRGWPLRSQITRDMVAGLISRGGEYLILSDPLDQYNDSLALLVDTIPSRLGPLHCYTVKEIH